MTGSASSSRVRSWARAAGEAAVALPGAALLFGAWRADRPWFQRHVLVPYYYIHPPWLPVAVRLAAAAAGLALLALVRPAVGRRLARRGLAVPSWGAWCRAAAAVAAALLASDLVLHVASPPDMKKWHPPIHVRVGQPDDRVGWRSRPSQTQVFKAAARPFTYAVNARGDRARSQADLPDPSRPALLVAGESIAVGFGLAWGETFAAICGRDLGLEVVNVAEGAYGSDQAYLRLTDALARTPRPAVVLTVFIPAQLGRLLRDDRPRLVLDRAGGLRLAPPVGGLRAASVLRDIVVNRLPYAGDAALDQALRTTSAVLQATRRAALARGARPLFVIPSIGPRRSFDDRPEAAVLRALFVEPGLPHVIVDLDDAALIPHDGHPNPEGARRLAAAIEAALRPL